MTLYPDLAQGAISTLAEGMGLTPQEAALGVLHVANVNINRALRRVSVARGHDPRAFTLVAFGGAGPLHACEVAAGLQIPRVLVPRYPGVLCALGLLMADVAIESSRSVLQVVSPEVEAQLHADCAQMVAQARLDLAREGIDEGQTIFSPLVDARYRGQSHELTVPLTEDVSAALHEAHASAYGHAMPDREVEVVNLRLQATGIVPKPKLTPEPVVANDGQGALIGHKTAVCRDGTAQSAHAAHALHAAREIALYDRDLLQPGAVFSGPALVFQMDSTVYLAPGWSARVDGYRNLVLERD
jgi:N-methylhydantoinase A